MTNRLLCLLLYLPTIFSAVAQTPYLLQDIHQPIPHLLDETELPFITRPGHLYFEGRSRLNEQGLWDYDGQHPAVLFETAPYSVRQAQGTATGPFLFTYDSQTDSYLWKSDGTPGSARLLDTVRLSGQAEGVPSVVFKDQLYYKAYRATTGWELWRSDGTKAGTKLFFDLRPGTGSGSPLRFAANDSLLFFTALDGANKIQLWRTDGTIPGTFALTTGVNPLNNLYDTPLVTPDAAFFQINTPSHDLEIWKSDGTAAGTVKVKTLNQVTGGYYPVALILQKKYLFQASDATYGAEWWVSDGTDNGTQLLKDISPGPANSFIEYARYASPVMGGQVFFFVDSTLWRTDGTPAGTLSVTGIPSGERVSIAASDSLYFFLRQNPTDSIELWRSDGSSAGTYAVQNLGLTDFSTYNGWSGAAVGNVVCFLFQRGELPGPFEDVDRVLIRSDGTPAGTFAVEGAPAKAYEGSDPANFVAASNGTVYFQASSEYGSYGSYGQAWKTTGNGPFSAVPADTTALHPYQIQGPFVLGERVLWIQNDSIFWVVENGNTTVSTHLFPDNTPFTYSAGTAVFNGILYLLLENGHSLWRTDGSPGGSFEVMTAPSPSLFYAITATADSLYWLQRFPVVGMPQQNLWASDGTAAGSSSVEQATSDSNVNWLDNRNEHISYVSYQLNPSGYNLKVRGFPVLFFENPSSSELTGLEVVGDRLFVLGPPKYNGSGIDFDLWVYRDGQLTLLQKFAALSNYNYYLFRQPDRLVGLGDQILFGAGPDGDVELWQSDGTIAGTQQLRDINPNGSSKPENFIRFNDQQWLFTAFDGNNTSWWATNGLAEGTFKIADLPSLPALENLSLPNVQNAFLHQHQLFFSMNDGLTGQEPWVLDLPDSLVVGLAGPASALANLTLYPNPAVDALRFSFENAVSGLATASLFDAQSRLVMRKKINLLAGETGNLVLGPGLVPGTYWLLIADVQGHRGIGKFQLQR